MNYDTWVVLQNAIKGNSFLHCNGSYGRSLSLHPSDINGCGESVGGQWTPGVTVQGGGTAI
jgi:hypothetical protein